MHLFTRVIADHKLVGVVSAVPTKLFTDIFSGNADKILRYPYYFDLVSRYALWLEAVGYPTRSNSYSMSKRANRKQ
jgi:hypothetical protein